MTSWSGSEDYADEIIRDYQITQMKRLQPEEARMARRSNGATDVWRRDASLSDEVYRTDRESADMSPRIEIQR